MSDKPIIIGGLIVVLAILTSPFWYSLAAGQSEPPVRPEVPEGKCVKSAEYMRAHHMDLLDEWRNEVVREGKAEMIEIDGKEYKKSLTEGCLSCHTSREKFCGGCHSYANVEPTCWNCHLETKGD